MQVDVRPPPPTVETDDDDDDEIQEVFPESNSENQENGFMKFGEPPSPEKRRKIDRQKLMSAQIPMVPRL